MMTERKYAFSGLDLFSHSRVYGNMKKSKFVSQRPDFKFQRPGLYGDFDLF